MNREELRPDDGNDLSRLDLAKQFVPNFFGFVHGLFSVRSLYPALNVVSGPVPSDRNLVLARG